MAAPRVRSKEPNVLDLGLQCQTHTAKCCQTHTVNCFASHLLHVWRCLTDAPVQVRAENERLRAAAAAGNPGKAASSASAGPPVLPGVSMEAASAALRKQVKEFTSTTQLDLQRQLKSWEARAIMAEEQLAHLQVRDERLKAEGVLLPLGM